MPKVTPLQSNFNGGEFSPYLKGRVDADRYKTGLSTCLNFIPTIQGGLTRRPGTMYVADVKDSSKATRLVRFEYSTTQAYIIEFGDQYCRFYMDEGQILSGGSPYEIATPFVEADLFQLRFVQSADVLYITHPDYTPRKLSRLGHASWTLAGLDFLDGPYLPLNTTSTTIAASATTGTVTLTASAALFASTDVGRRIRKQDAGNWSWLEIVGYTDPTHVTATVRGSAIGVAATTNWRLGLWSATTGYPAVATFHEDRLCFTGAAGAPQRIDMSVTGDYENFKPTAADGTIADDYALNFTLNSADVNVGRWMVSDEKGLLIGTVGGEWTVTTPFGEALGASTVPSAKQVTDYGSADIAPVRMGKSVLFLQRSTRILREMSYYYEDDGFKSPNRTILSEHITGETGIKEMAHQKEPQSILWCVRNDGVLVGMTYERDEAGLIIGWHRHIIGGSSDAAGSDAVVESAATIPSPDGTYQQLWLVVRRWIDGATARKIEIMKPLFSDTVEQKDAFFVDCGLTYDDPKTITGITSATPPVVTSAGHGFSNGDLVLPSGVASVGDNDEDATDRLSDLVNGQTFKVANVTANTFELQDVDGNNIVGAGKSAYVSGGEVRKYVTTISGLDHLEGESVDICADGAVQPAKTVSTGSITLTTRATTVNIGLGYRSDGQMLRVEGGSANGTSMGKKRRTNLVSFLLHRSLGLKVGTDFDHLDPLPFRSTSDPLSRAVPLYTGFKNTGIRADYDFENQVAWRQDQPLPLTILLIALDMDVADRL